MNLDLETDKGESMKITNVLLDINSKQINVTFKNRENNKCYTNTYDNTNKLNSYLSKFGVIYEKRKSPNNTI